MTAFACGLAASSLADEEFGSINIRKLQQKPVREVSWRRWKRRRAPHRREPGGIERRITAREIKRLMGEIAKFVDKEPNAPDVGQMTRARSRRLLILAADQAHEQGFIACLFRAAANRRRFGLSAE